MKPVFLRHLSLCVCSTMFVFATGCALQTTAVDAPSEITMGAISGVAHGGANPIFGGNVILWQTVTGTSVSLAAGGTGTSGYGTAKAKVLGTGTTSLTDGSFSITPTDGTTPGNAYTCTSTEYVYLTVTGGVTGANASNPNSVQIAALGSCSHFGTADRSAIYVYVSEMSTVAAAYALGNFISINAGSSAGNQQVYVSAPPTNAAATGSCSGTGATLACTGAGLAHAFQNAFDLADVVAYNGYSSANAARTQVPTGVSPTATSANSFVPATLLNTIANILEACVNTTGGAVSAGASDGSVCGNLFFYTKSLATGGTYPTDTLGAAINMAKYPLSNASSIYALATPNTYYLPALTQAPTDFSVAIFYSGTSAAPFGYVYNLALDANDNVYAEYGSVGMGTVGGISGSASGVVGMTSNGVSLIASTANSSFINPGYLATDMLGHVWVTNINTSAGTIPQAVRYINTTLASGTAGAENIVTLTGNFAITGVAVDRANNVWVTSQNAASSPTAYNLVELQQGSSYAAATFTHSPTLSVLIPSIALDANQNVWMAGLGSTAMGVFPNVGAAPNTPTYSGSVVTGTQSSAGPNSKLVGGGVALDSSGNAYYAAASKIDKTVPTSTSGTITSFTQSNPKANSLGLPFPPELDGAGLMWFGTYTAGGLLYSWASGAGATSYGPCYPVANGGSPICSSQLSTGAYTPSQYPRAVQVDSTGSVWFATGTSISDSTTAGMIVQLIGPGTPTWPQISYGKPGVMP